jgi:hypothetical protein
MLFTNCFFNAFSLHEYLTYWPVDRTFIVYSKSFPFEGLKRETVGTLLGFFGFFYSPAKIKSVGLLLSDKS